MGGNPKDSPWYSTPRGQRKRKDVSFTLSDAARAKLAALVEARGGIPKSVIIEELILAAALHKGSK